jgi:hypothetical protein
VLRGAGIALALADVHRPVVDMLRRSGLLAEVGEDRVHRTVDEAIRSLAREPTLRNAPAPSI